ncbi:MAG: DVU0298 family protein, partial [Pseudomonadota bacterium]
DYLEKQVKHYDLETHRVVHGGAYEGRQINGTLYFIRLHQDIREVTDDGAKRLLERATPVTTGSSLRKRGRKSFSKEEIESLVESYSLEALLDLAGGDQRILRDLKRLLYTPDKLSRWRAADVMGQVSAVIAERDPGAISRLLQGLFTSLVDTAASSWGALNAIGEIIRSRPEQFAGYIPQIYKMAGDRELLPEILRALGRIGERRPEPLRKQTLHFLPFLRDTDTEIRGYTVILLGHLGAREAIDDLKELLQDSGELDVYGEGKMERKSIGRLAEQALGKL